MFNDFRKFIEFGHVVTSESDILYFTAYTCKPLVFLRCLFDSFFKLYSTVA